MSKGGKSGYLLTSQVVSPNLTYEMLKSVQIEVDEIVTTRDSAGALVYTFIHVPRRVTGLELDRGLKTLAETCGVKGSNIFGYDTISSSSIGEGDSIENHPGFRVLVQHEAQGVESFSHWRAAGFAGSSCGYMKLKARLLAKRQSSSSGRRQHSSASMGSGEASDSPSEEQETFESGSGKQERNKRKRKPAASSPPPAGTGGASGRGFGMDASAVDFMRGVMQEAARRTDAMLELQGTVTSFKFEKRIAELEGAVARLNGELSEKNLEIGRLMGGGCVSELQEKVKVLTTEKQNVEAEAGRQASEHANQLALKDAELSRLLGAVEHERADLREMTRLKEVVACVDCCDFSSV
jgi:hypothetical protein